MGRLTAKTSLLLSRQLVRLVFGAGMRVWTCSSTRKRLKPTAPFISCSPKKRFAWSMLNLYRLVRNPCDMPTVSPSFPSPIWVKMKLTSFRDKDRVHVRDMDGVGLITAEVEAGLSPTLAERLKQIRETE